MSKRSARYGLKVLLTAALALGPVAAYSEPQAPQLKSCSAAVQKAFNACVQEGQDAGVIANLTMVSGEGQGLNGGANAQTQMSCNGSANMTALAQHCSEAKARSCKKENCNNNDGQLKACNDAFDQIINNANNDAQSLASVCAKSGDTTTQSTGSAPTPQSTGAAGGGGNNGMGNMLAGAALGALAGVGLMMAMNQNSDSSSADAASDSAFDPTTGMLNCAASDAAKYADCESVLAQNCAQQLAAGSSSVTASCYAFTQKYCAGTKTASPGTANLSAENGSTHQFTLAGNGDGTGGSYCQTALSHAYCDGGAHSASCPACAQLASNSSAACQANPAECMAQNSYPQLAAMASQCPGDPVIALAQQTNSTAMVVAGADASTTVVLPSSLKSGAASLTAGAAATAASGGTTLSVMPSSISRGPASDVEGQFGPSVASTVSQLIQRRCQTGQLKCH